MIEPNHVQGRMVALIASMFVSLVAGTPYLYGVYAPQLVQRIGLSTSDAATISLSVNIGSGLGGLPAGLFIDRFGPQKSIVFGSLCIFTGYFCLNRIYSLQIGSLLLVCVAMAFVGFGSVTSFFAGLKAAQANFPHHRGSAGVLPVGAYGLAATIFSLVAARLFDGDSGGLLSFLAFFCGSVAFVGSWFIHIYDPARFDLEAEVASPTPMKRSLSLRGSFSFWGIGSRSLSQSLLLADQAPLVKTLREQNKRDNSRMKPLVSMSSLNLNTPFSQDSSAPPNGSSSIGSPTSPTTEAPVSEAPLEPDSAWATIRNLVEDKTFLVHYVIISLCSGIGQMYIYTVGFIVTAQFNIHEDADGSPASLQAIQVSTISIASFSGRVVAGFLSDYLHKRLHAQRQWVVIGTIFMMLIGQLLLMLTNNLSTITLSSLLIGGGYGLLNGTYPSIIADTFGVKTFTTAWGLTCSGPLVILFSLNRYFGKIYDSQSDETGVCLVGNECYKGAFQLSTVLCVVTLGINLTLIYFKRR